MSIFERATKEKLRFDGGNGLMSVEDLWDLKLKSRKNISLNQLAIKLDAQIKENQVTDFVDDLSTRDNELDLKFDVVKHIIKVKLNERETRMNAAKVKEERERILGLIERKQNEALEGESIEDLQARLNELG